MIMAEGEGFEPPETCASAIFKQGGYKSLTCSDAPDGASAPKYPTASSRRAATSMNDWTLAGHLRTRCAASCFGQ